MLAFHPEVTRELQPTLGLDVRVSQGPVTHT